MKPFENTMPNREVTSRSKAGNPSIVAIGQPWMTVVTETAKEGTSLPTEPPRAWRDEQEGGDNRPEVTRTSKIRQPQSWKEE